VILLSLVLGAHAFAQESPTSHTAAITPLSELLEEAEKNNPQIEAARQGWEAAKQVPTQVSTLPDPQFNLQHVRSAAHAPLPATATATSPTLASVFRKTYRIQASCA